MGSSKKMKSNAAAISVVVPLCNERPALEELYNRLTASLTQVADEYEIIFVDDGSVDGSIEKIKEFRATDPAVRYVRFRRNFGKSAALAAGFRSARYPIIATMDADVQDMPEQLSLLVDKLKEGCDLVS